MKKKELLKVIMGCKLKLSQTQYHQTTLEINLVFS